MAELKEARVPDIGGHEGVPVIELLVAIGDTVTVDQGLLTLESDKATMEVPSPFAGVIKSLKVKLGDSLTEGDLVAEIETADVAPDAAPEKPKESAVEAPAKQDSPREAKPEPESKPKVAETDESKHDAKHEPKGEPATPPKPSTADSAAPMGAGLPPVRFEADAVLPDKVPYASP
ncbi:MAG: branched-chain alpha-keto acid dehydrogenase subunit E2, partial [Pseudomonadota bacterium]|nr:branched-chain alpha-keto acid dehydrogenase subunit E2 [Pseudomonadota bacterium]